MNVDDVKPLADKLRHEIAKAIIGQDDTIDLLLNALFAGGHILLEGPPGSAKTFLAQCFARAVDLDFGRVQFTPDLMPGDVIGSNLIDFATSTFKLTKGPIFCELLLADEINRTPPKTQAALLEAMQERAVAIDGHSHQLSPHFMPAVHIILIALRLSISMFITAMVHNIVLKQSLIYFTARPTNGQLIQVPGQKMKLVVPAISVMFPWRPEMVQRNFGLPMKLRFYPN